MQDKHPQETAKTPSGQFAPYLSIATLVLFLLFSFWLYGYRPIASYPESSVDDGLYLRHGNAFVNWLCGNNPRWLGDYDCFLFAKAPLYGLFLGVLNLLCVPVRVGEFVLLVGVPYLFFAACRPVVALRGWARYVAAALLMWLPLLPSDTHLQRMGLQSMLTSYLITALIGLVVRWRWGFREQWRWAALLGLLFSLNYLNREEAAWVSIAVLFSLFLFCALAKLQGCFSWRRGMAVSSVVVVSAAPLILLVCALNYSSYGVFMTTIRRSDGFTSAYQRLTSLEPELHKRYVPISRETRFRAYELSPSFAKLKPIMEGNSTYWVAGIDEHSSLNGYKPEDREFFVSNYEFALEYAAFASGATTAAKVEAFFSSIDKELESAVRAGRIRAGIHGPAILAAPVPGDLGRGMKAWWKSLHGLLTLNGAGLDWTARSIGSAAELENVSLFVHSSLAPESTDGIHYKLRFRLVGAINRLLSVVYWSAIPLALVISILSYARQRTAFFQGTAAVSIPLLALSMFCLTMAIVDTLGFPFIDSIAYNVMGYSPISVLAAFTFATTLAYFRKGQPETKST